MTEFADILKSAGLEDEKVSEVMEQMKENSLHLASEENLDTRYSKLKQDKESLEAKHAEAESLIAELKAKTENEAELQSKVSEYEQKLEALAEESKRKDAENALKVSLLEAGVEDIDYISYKIKQDGDIQLDENGKIVGIDDKIADLKTRFPSQFAAESSEKKIEEKPLEKGEENDYGITPDEFAKMGYQSRLQLKKDNPDAYEALSEGK